MPQTAEEQLTEAVVQLAGQASTSPSKADVEAMVRALLIEGGQPAKSSRPQLGTTRLDPARVKRQAAALRQTLECSPLHSLLPGLCRMLRTVESLDEDFFNALDQHSPAEKPSVSPPRVRGALPHEHLALTAALVYVKCTHRKPTIHNAEGRPAHGPFMDFLATVFTARDIRRSVETSARWALEHLPSNAKRSSPVPRQRRSLSRAHHCEIAHGMERAPRKERS